MFKLVAAAFLGASSVLASNVPVFSANDDYDEVNLNIRLLAAHNATDSKKAYKVQGSFKASFTFPEGTTAATLNEDTAFKSGLETAISGAIDGVDASMTKVDKIEDASAAAAATRRLAAHATVTLALKVLYTITFATAEAATAAAALIDTSANSSFMSALTTGLTAAATAAGATFDTASLTAEAPTVVTPAPAAGSTAATEAPAAAAPAPAAASSSDATMLKANMAVAAVAALVASIFA